MYWNQKSPWLWDCHRVLKRKTWTAVYYAVVVLPSIKIRNNTLWPSTDRKSTGCATLYVPGSAKDIKTLQFIFAYICTAGAIPEVEIQARNYYYRDLVHCAFKDGVPWWWRNSEDRELCIKFILRDVITRSCLSNYCMACWMLTECYIKQVGWSVLLLVNRQPVGDIASQLHDRMGCPKCTGWPEHFHLAVRAVRGLCPTTGSCIHGLLVRMTTSEM